jgi:hypothetical protein
MADRGPLDNLSTAEGGDEPAPVLGNAANKPSHFSGSSDGDLELYRSFGVKAYDRGDFEQAVKGPERVVWPWHQEPC